MSNQYISEIVINNFRNYLTKKIDFSKNTNIIEASMFKAISKKAPFLVSLNIPSASTNN